MHFVQWQVTPVLDQLALELLPIDKTSVEHLCFPVLALQPHFQSSWFALDSPLIIALLS